MQRKILQWTVGAGMFALAISVLGAQAPADGVFFDEGWEAGVLGQSFNSRYYGSTSGDQFTVDPITRGAGLQSLRHRLSPGMSPGSIQYATQHFGDAINGPILPARAGEHLNDLYVQYKVFYAPGFDLGTMVPKQLIIGTEDERRHDNVCCNPWVSHYMTIYPPSNVRGILVGEANNKQAPTGQWVGFVQNRGGYGPGNLMVTQTGRWYTVEVRRRLNDNGVDNGIFQMWIDGVLLSEHTSVRYRVPWNGTVGANPAYGTNFAMLSDYLNDGSRVDQSVYYDDVRFSSTYIGTGSNLPTAPRNLRITPTPPH